VPALCSYGARMTDRPISIFERCSLTDVSAALKQRFCVSRQTFWVGADLEQRSLRLSCYVGLPLAHHFMMLRLAKARPSADLACPVALAQDAARTSGIKLMLFLNIFECSHRARTQTGQRQIPCDLHRAQLRSTP